MKKYEMGTVPAFTIKNRAICVSFISLLIFSCMTSLSLAGETAEYFAADLKKMTLEELMEVEVETVYGASKYEQKITEAPSSVTVITSDEIRKYGYRTLAGILKSVRGFSVTNDRNYSYLGVRGFARPNDYNSRILILVDGHSMNNNVYNSTLIGLDFILDVDIIDRIEVIRGPSSSLYGTSAFFGVINIYTKKGLDFKGPELSGEPASFRTYKGRFSYGNKFNNSIDMLISGSVSDSKGQDLFFQEFDSPVTHHGIARNSDYERAYNLFSKLSYKGFTLEGAYVSRTKGVPTGSYGTVFNDPRNQAIDDRGYVDLSYISRLGKQSEVQARIYYDDFSYDGDYIYDNPPVTLNKDISSGKWLGTELKLIAPVLKTHKITLGTEYRYNMQEVQKNYDIDPFFSYLNDKRHSTVWALYIQDEFKILPHLILNAGMRYDHYDTFGSTTNPRLALIYNPFSKTILKLLYGEAFRAPNAFELYYQDGGISSKSNPELHPETIKTYEMVLEQYIGKNLLISASGFYYKINDLISQQLDPADGLLVFQNIENIEAKGLELEINCKWENGLNGRMSYTFQKTKNRQTGEILTNSPKHLVKLNMIVPFIKEKLFLGIEEQYMSKRRTTNDKEADAFFITNLTLLSRELIKGMELSGSVYNLFDEIYGDPVGAELRQDTIEQDGRSFRVKLTYRF